MSTREKAPDIPFEKPVKADPGERTLRLGNAGTDVKHLQGILGRFLDDVPHDGRFGDATDAAVRRYQRLRGLKQTGEVGPATWGPVLAEPEPGPEPAE
jgi:peptidoglycan hydrolase-like protein with peptidoglycan-binding domain